MIMLAKSGSFVGMKWAKPALLALALAFCANSASALTADQEEQTRRFALGNAVWILYHEIGHLLVNEFQLPVLGREEDAADHLATITLLEISDETNDGFLVDAVDGFFFSADVKTKRNASRSFYAGHGLDEQRAFEVACLMLGNDPQAFTELADTINLPLEERERCPNAYELARSSWHAVLQPHTVGWFSGNSADTIAVSYGETGRTFAAAKEIIESAGVLELAADYLSSKYAFPRPAALRGEECGDSNAFFDPNAGEVVLCYELIEEFRQILVGYFNNQR